MFLLGGWALGFFCALGILVTLMLNKGYGDTPFFLAYGIGSVACFRVARAYAPSRRPEIDPFSTAGGWSD
jgi:hypothetical protein